MENNYSYPPQQPAPKNSSKIVLTIILGILALAIIICCTVISLSLISSSRNIVPPDDPVPGTSESTASSTSSSQTEPLPTETVPSDTQPSSPKITSDPVSGEVLTVPEIYKRNINAVVYIETTVTIQRGFYSYPSGYCGTGYVVSEDGYILTCAHVVDGANTIKVTLYDGTEYPATLIGGSIESDVAIIKIEAKDLSKVSLGDSDKIEIGEDCIVIGNPQGLNFSVTKGIVSCVDRTINVDSSYKNTIQIDAPVNGGNSGGPVFNSRGEVIAMVDAKIVDSSVEGLSFALPINEVISVVNDILEYGYVTGKPYFGISVSTASTYYGFATNGARIEAIDESSCAQKAGLKIGDIITAIDNTPISSSADLLAVKNKYKAGNTAVLTIFREGQTLTVSITFDEAKS